MEKHLYQQGLELGRLLSECKQLVESGREAEATLMVPSINGVWSKLDKDCKAAGYKGGAAEFSRMTEQT